jgi:hypothetical protein
MRSGTIVGMECRVNSGVELFTRRYTGGRRLPVKKKVRTRNNRRVLTYYRSPAATVERPNGSPQYSFRGYLTTSFQWRGAYVARIPADESSDQPNPPHQQGRNKGTPNYDSAQTTEPFPPPHRLFSSKARQSLLTYILSTFPANGKRHLANLAGLLWFVEMLRMPWEMYDDYGTVMALQ